MGRIAEGGTRHDWPVLAGASALLVAGRLALRFEDPTTAGRLLSRLARAVPPYRNVGDPDRIASAIRVVAHRLPGTGTCLPNALAAEAMLASHRHEPRLLIGVAKEDGGGLIAHAWVEHDGRVVVGDIEDLSRYRPLRGARDGRFGPFRTAGDAG